MDQISRIYGPIKIPSVNLPSLSFGKFSLKFSNPLPRLFIAVTKFYINANLICSGDNKILSLSTSGRYLTHFSLEMNFIARTNP